MALQCILTHFSHKIQHNTKKKSPTNKLADFNFVLFSTCYQVYRIRLNYWAMESGIKVHLNNVNII